MLEEGQNLGGNTWVGELPRLGKNWCTTTYQLAQGEKKLLGEQGWWGGSRDDLTECSMVGKRLEKKGGTSSSNELPHWSGKEVIVTNKNPSIRWVDRSSTILITGDGLA